MTAMLRQSGPRASTLGPDDGWDAASVERSMSETIEGAATALPRAVILVEGMSDRRALEVLAAQRGRDLTGEGVTVVAMDGAGNIGRFLERYGPRGSDVALAGLYDAAEEAAVRRGLERAGFGSVTSRRALERLGFYACSEDLEDELIRALGADRVTAIVEERGELGPFRTLQKQPEWRGRPAEQQLKRFLGNSSRKIDYAPLLVDALDLSRVPRPLDAVLGHV
jgi:OLD-like protein